MISLIFLCALCFGTTVESLQTITHSDHLDVMHEPVYICILAGIDFLVWCLVFRCIGGYTFHQRTAVESECLKRNPHLPCLTIRRTEENDVDNLEDKGDEGGQSELKSVPPRQKNAHPTMDPNALEKHSHKTKQ